MKTVLRLALLTIIFSAACQQRQPVTEQQPTVETAAPLPEAYVHTDEIVEVIFHDQLTQAELDHIQSDLAAQDYTLTYDELTFNEQGRLSGIKFRIMCPDGYNGGATNIPIQQGTYNGFIRDMRPNAKVGFVAGLRWLEGKPM